LSLQRPVTDVQDEPIFIIYHQITELYFKLARIEIDAIAVAENLEVSEFTERIHRLNRYFGALRSSFGVMEKGMKKEEFLSFRDALAPASGFQSVQYRIIELGCAPLINIVAEDKREIVRGESIEDQMDYIYWKDGAKVTLTGQPAFTAVQFIDRYWDELVEAAEIYEHCNVWERYQELLRGGLTDAQQHEIEVALRLLDLNVNVNWPLQHYKTAVRYLSRNPSDIAATGGTNWQKYLPPRFQRRIFYPELWTDEQRAEWGKSWVDQVLKELEAEV
jgi:tryptophan 2,3-dioxygenase